MKKKARGTTPAPKAIKQMPRTSPPIIALIERALDYGLPVLIVLVTLSFSLQTANTFTLPKFVVLLAGTALLGALWVVHALLGTREFYIRSGADIPVVLLTVASIASTLFSVNRAMSVLGSYERLDGLLSTLAYILVFVLSIQLFYGRRERIDTALKTIVAVATVTSLYGLVQYLGLDPIGWPSEGFESTRSFSTFGNPVLLGSFLAMVFPVALALLLTRQRAVGLAWYGASVLAIGAAVLTTFSRGAWVATAGAGLLFIAYGVKGMQKQQWLRFIAVAAVLVLTLIALSTASAGSGDATDLAQRISSLARPGDASSMERLEIWKSALAMVAERPLLGFGPDTFRSMFSSYETLSFVHIGGYQETADNAHNYALQLATTTGLAGLLAALFAVVLALGYGVRRARRVAHEDGLVYMGITLGIVSYAISLFFGITAPAGMVGALVLAGALVSVSPDARVRTTTWRTPVNTRYAASVLVVLVALAALGASMRAYSADRAVATADYLAYSGDLPSAIQEYERAAALNPYNDYYHSVHGEALFSLAQETREPTILDESISALSRAQHLNPNEFDNYMLLAQAYMYGAQSFDPTYLRYAMEQLHQATEVKRYPVLAHYFLGQIYSDSGDKKRALEHLNKSIAMDPNFDAAKSLVKTVQGDGAQK